MIQLLPSAPLPRSLRYTQNTPHARRGVDLRRRLLKLLQTEGPMTAAEIADEMGIPVQSIYNHLRRLYKDSIHVGFWNRRDSGHGHTGWTAVFFPGKQPDARYPEPDESRMLGKRNPEARHTWGITPVSPSVGPSPSR